MNPPESPSQVLKIAVVGTGNRAQAHLSTIQKMTDMYRLVGVSDTLPGRADEVGQRLGVNGYLDFKAMLEETRPDVVLITAPPPVHHTLARTAARHKVHVMCETPIAITLPYADAMVEAAQQNGVQLEITENVWRFPQERFKRMLLDSGLLGQVTAMRLWYASGSYHGMNAVRVLAGCRPVRAVGMVKVVSAPGCTWGDRYIFQVFGPAGEPLPTPGVVSKWGTWEAGLYEFDNGITLSYELPISRLRGNWWEIQATNGWMSGNDVVIGSDRRCRIIVESESIEGVNVVARARLMDKDEQVSELVWENPFKRYRSADIDEVARMDQLTSMYRAVTEGMAPEYGAANAREDLEMLVALRESARLGNLPVSMPVTYVTGYEQKLIDLYGPPDADA